MQAKQEYSPRQGTLWWITGLSGAGKTTVARILQDRLSSSGRQVFLMDGDTMRHILGHVHGYSQDDRLYLASVYGRLAHEMVNQGLDVVCATISMFHGIQKWNRDNIRNYREIYLKVPVKELIKRDNNGLYSRSRAGIESGIIGIDIVPHEPVNPDLVVDCYGQVSPEEAARRIMSLEDIHGANQS
ncbi:MULTISPECIES: adenylyl-sulfate kinase [unclassified Haematospirillum]|uniref:adenylyl-sulfate kinase n=1 Tax=unclassified Haematospirillum TaxID=2622088 RepID=UPI00143B8577|nr:MULTISPECIES: adenylyl-sulfate kinase [unclassified Haematospirillum]NKD56077.1 adenylyl-sulfate kinase [Haematospirillum sp. H4890]NKD76126.1 adenylyl-sulfate kinase [Haematospirillum sp. H4485]